MSSDYTWIKKAAASRAERADRYPRNVAQAAILSFVHDQLNSASELDESTVKEYIKLVNHLQYQTFDREYRNAVWSASGEAYTRNRKRFAKS